MKMMISLTIIISILLLLIMGAIYQNIVKTVIIIKELYLIEGQNNMTFNL